LPALRDRRGDIALLSQEFLAEKHPGKRIAPAALARLAAHDWPGNVRELRNVVERMVLLADGDVLTTEHLPPELAQGAGTPTEPPRASSDAFAVSEVMPLDDLLAAYLRWAAARTADRVSLARALGVSERTLYRKLHDARRRA